MLGYGTRSTAFNLLTYAASKVDLWLVGETLGTRATGMYDRAVHLMGQPITVLGKLGDSVLFSGLSSLQDNLPEMQRVVLRGMHLIALATLPLTVALVWQAEGVTWLFLGPQFDESAPIVQVLFAAVAFRALTKLGDANMRALDGLTAGIAIKVVFLAAIAAGVWWNLDQGHGTVGAAKAVVLASVLQWLLTVGWMSVRLKLRLFPLPMPCEGGLILSVVVAVPMAAAFLGVVGRICPVCRAGDGHPCVVSRPQLAPSLGPTRGPSAAGRCEAAQLQSSPPLDALNKTTIPGVSPP